MARKRKTSPFEDLLDAVALMPWWVGVSIAVVGYVVLHHMAAPVQITAVQPGQIGSLVAKSAVAGIASVGQYLVVLIGLLGAVMSFIRRKQRKDLLADVAQAQSASALDGMDWREFEMLVGEAFRFQGYQVIETGGGGADGGVDLVLSKGNEKSLVQCKQWKAYKVGVDVVRELYGVMAAKGATGGFVVTSGQFTSDAQAFAEGRNIELVDGPKLFSLIKRAKQSLANSSQKLVDKSNSANPGDGVEPSCPSADPAWSDGLHKGVQMLAASSGGAVGFRLAKAFGSWIDLHSFRG
jgi:restriction system protein